MNYEKKIAAAIIAAQTASNAGKGITGSITANEHCARSAQFFKYDIKPTYIIRALNLINGRRTQFNYWVCATPDQNGYRSVLVYFTFKHEGVKYQISFHTPYNIANDLISFVGKGLPMRWDKKSSMEACKILAKIYNL